MASLSDYHLCWADTGTATAGTSSSSAGTGLSNGQYVFSTRVEMPFNLRRVRTVQDLVQVLAGGDNLFGERLVVAGLALLVGNLLVTGRWLWLIVSIIAALWFSILVWWKAALVLTALQAWPILNALWGELSLEWFAMETVTVIVALMVLAGILYVTQDDPRSYALLREKSDSAVRIRNDCFMDVKFLVFNGEDTVRMVPQGGLLGGSLVRRGETHLVGEEPPYIVKAYAPFEKELGTYCVPSGSYSFRATAPPLLVLPSSNRSQQELPSFRNSSEVSVRVAICPATCWTNSLWLPFAPVFARIRWGTKAVGAGTTLVLSGRPAVLRVYPIGFLGSFVELAACSLSANEGAEYLGEIKWNCPPKGSFRKSCSSSLLNKLH